MREDDVSRLGLHIGSSVPPSHRIDASGEAVTSDLGEAVEPLVGRRKVLPLGRVLAVGALILILVLLIVVPAGTALWGAFRDGGPGTGASYTVAKFAAIYATPRFFTAVGNTLLIGVAAALLAVGLAGYLAWLTERTDVPGRGIIYVFVLLSLIMPGIIHAIAWVLILGDRIGIANALLDAIGIPALFNAFTIPAMIWTAAADNLSLPFLLMAAAFRSTDPTLEEASEVSGASYKHTFWRITVPILRPSTLAAFVIVFIRVIEDFNVPAAMALPGGIPLLQTEVWIALRRFPTDYNLASAFGANYLVIALLGLSLYYYLTRGSDRFVTVSGKAFRPGRRKLGRRRYIHALVGLAIVGISVGLTFLVILYTSLMPFYARPSGDSLSRIGIDNYRWAIDSQPFRSALANNLRLALPTGALTVAIAAMVSWVVLRSRTRGRRLLDAIAFSPIAVPGLVMALAFAWFVLTLNIPIYGTLLILSLAFIAKSMPYAVRATHASLSQLGGELEEASQVSGASVVTTLRRIVFPLISGGLLVAFIFVVAYTFKVLSIPAILSGPRSMILPVFIMDMYSNGEFARLCAVGVIMFGLLTLLFAISRIVSRRIGYDVDAA